MQLSQHLCEEHAHEFDIWWNPDKFDWWTSGMLAEYCSQYFDKWWDSDKFNWEYNWLLPKYCS